MLESSLLLRRLFCWMAQAPGAFVGGGPGYGKMAWAGLVRALRAHTGCGADASLWAHDVAREYRM